MDKEFIDVFKVSSTVGYLCKVSSTDAMRSFCQFSNILLAPLFDLFKPKKKSYTIKKNPQEFLVLYKHHCRPILMFKIKSTNYYREGLRIGYIP